MISKGPLPQEGAILEAASPAPVEPADDQAPTDILTAASCQTRSQNPPYWAVPKSLPPADSEAIKVYWYFKGLGLG